MNAKKVKDKLIETLKNKGWHVINIAISSGGVPDLICCSPRGRFVGFRVVNNIQKPKTVEAIKEAISFIEKGGLYIEFDGSAESEKTLLDALKMEIRPDGGNK